MLRRSARRILQGASAMVALAAAGATAGAAGSVAGGPPGQAPSPSSNADSAAPLAPSVNSPPPSPLQMHMLNTTNSTLSFSAAGDDEWREDGERIILSTDQGFIKTETYYVDKDISDLHTVFLACALTVAPLLGVFFSVLGIRYVWKKFQEDNNNDDCNDMLARADTSNPSTRQSLSAEQVKASESQFSVLPIEEVDETSSNGPPSVSGAMFGVGVGTAPQSGTHASVLPISQSTASSQSSNGSIITLMMKNNTLIVEKQEPAMVITRSIPTDSLAVTPTTASPTTVTQATEPSPAAALSEKAKVARSNTTGLSQSDTSISSIGSTGHNPGYQYGNQIGYDTGPMGYPSYTGYVIPIAPDRKPASAPSPWPSADYASLVASLRINTTPQVSFDEDVSPEEKRRCALNNQRKRAHVRTGSCGPGQGMAEEDDDAEDAAAAAVAAARAQKRSSLPLLQPLTLLVADERPLRSPVLDKLRFEDSLSAMERLPQSLSPPAIIGTSPNPTGAMPKSPPPRSPLAALPIPEEDATHAHALCD